MPNMVMHLQDVIRVEMRMETVKRLDKFVFMSLIYWAICTMFS